MLQGIRSGQNQVNDFRVDGELRLSDGIQQGLQIMSQVLHGSQMKKTGTSLECMKSPKDGIDRARVSRIRLENNQTLLDLLQKLRGLRQKLPQKLRILRKVELDGRLVG